MKLCAHLSKLAYKRPASLDITAGAEVLNSVGNNKKAFPVFIDGNPLSDAQAYIWLLEDGNGPTPKFYMYVCFRGTESTRDVLADIDIIFDTLEGDIRVHAGFHHQYKSMENKLYNFLDELVDKYETIVCCGHSLGGALAALSAPIIAERYPTKDVRCYTYGAPRVGNKSFITWFNKTVADSCRVVNERDPVTQIPLGFEYVHAGGGICLKDDNKFQVLKGDIPWYWRLFYSLKRLNFRGIIKEHDTSLYIDRLMKLPKST